MILFSLEKQLQRRYVGKVREYAQTFTLEEAMKKAVKYCMDNDILKTFLETHSSEVFNMLLTEWDTEEAKIVWREEGFEDGLEEGREKGLEEGMGIGMEKGREETRQFFLELLNQGLTAEEMKQRLSQIQIR